MKMLPAQIPTPYFTIDASKVLDNAQFMLQLAKERNVQIRPHIKTHKVPELARIQTTKPRAVTVSTISELDEFYRHGFRDILYAIPFTVSKLPLLLPFIRDENKIILLLDDVNEAQKLGQALVSNGQSVSVRVKIDIGSGRAGVEPNSKRLYTLVDVISSFASLRFDGIMSHPHHAYQAQSVQQIKDIAAKEVAIMRAVTQSLVRQGHEVNVVSIGSTPTCMLYHEWEGITEIRPGNYLLFDYFQHKMGVCSLDQIACRVIATVIGCYPERNTLLLDAGAIALSKDMGAKHLGVSHFGLIEGTTLTISALSQEHGIVHNWSEEKDSFQVGDRVAIIPNHSCLTAAQYSEFWLTGEQGVNRKLIPAKFW